MRGSGQEVIVLNPPKLHLIYNYKNNDNKINAETLASVMQLKPKLLSLNYLMSKIRQMKLEDINNTLPMVWIFAVIIYIMKIYKGLKYVLPD